MRLADLVALAGGGPTDRLFVESMRSGGGFGQVNLNAGQSQAAESLLALRMGGEDLSRSTTASPPTQPHSSGSCSTRARCPPSATSRGSITCARRSRFRLSCCWWFPLILGGRADAFRAATGLGTEMYLGRWLTVTGVLILISALAYALRLRRSAGSHRSLS